MVAPSTQALLTQWTWEPSVLIGCAALTGAYFYLIGPLRERRDLGPPISRGQATCFVISVILLVLALLSPLDYIGDSYLFSAHMVQHLILATVWPVLFLLAMPVWTARALFRVPGHALIETIVYPAFATMFFTADIYAWHLPVPYDLTLTNEGVHVLEHLTFMFCGLLVFWRVLSPAREQRLPYPLQVLYLMVNGMLMMIPGIVFTFAPSAFYPAYVHAPRLWESPPYRISSLGGSIMWYPGNLPYAALLVVAFYRWFESQEVCAGGGGARAAPRFGLDQAPAAAPGEPVIAFRPSSILACAARVLA